MCTDCIDEDVIHEARHTPQAEPEFVFACTRDELVEGKAITREFDHDEVAIYLIRGEIFATTNICPHEGSPLLAEGTIDCERKTVECPVHRWVFSVETGIANSDGLTLKTYRTRVIDGEVWVEEPAPKPLIHIEWDEDADRRSEDS
jgi:nitrite reductase (NADH) small subunit